MSNELALISDGKGLAVIGNSTEVERFLAAEGLTSSAWGPGIDAPLDHPERSPW